MTPISARYAGLFVLDLRPSEVAGCNVGRASLTTTTATEKPRLERRADS